jgi:arylsulfatase A-like enzyme
MNALCLVIDGLRAGFLGCYGNSWVQTPAIDRLAAAGFVFDQALIDSPRLVDAYRAYWLGVHSFAPEPASPIASLPQMLGAAGVATALVTDEGSLSQNPLAATFHEIVQVPASQSRTAASSDDTQLAAIFSAAAEWIEHAQAPFCLWVHAQGMHAAWDAPAALREQYADEDGVPIPSFVEPPQFWLPPEHDPDQLLTLRWACAAQVSLLDRCLEAFLEWFDAQLAARDTLLVLLGSRGYPLGEHGRVGMAEAGTAQTSLHEELVHVPWIVRMPDGAGASDRSQALIQPADLAGTLAEWFQLASNQLAPGCCSWLNLLRGERPAFRDRACLQADDGQERAIRTAAWHLIRPAGGAARKLFAKPDDRWEANEVADRCGDVADLLEAALEEAWQASQQGQHEITTPLADVLEHGLT